MNRKKSILLPFVLFSFLCNAQILTENFDNISALTNWDIINVSNPIGTNTWQQGNGVLGAQSGISTSYISVNASTTTGTGTNSAWLILPSLSLKDGDKINFYTRSDNQANFPDRLQVRLSTNGNSSVAPTDELDIGDYSTLLLDINSTLMTNVYPITYTEYEITISGIGTVTTDTRIAFRYFVPNGGPDGGNAFAIAIDTLTITEETLSLDENVNSNAFNYFYNKNTKMLSLKSSDLNLEKIELYNVIGKNVLSKNINSSSEDINLENLRDGLYIFKVSIGNAVKTVKFIKQ